MSRFAGKTVLFMAGGTGGHVYPALTVAAALAAEGAAIHWLGNQDGFEGRAVAGAGYPLHDIRVRGLRGNGVLGWLKAPWMVSRAVARAAAVMGDIHPDVVVGMGGFAAGPGGVAARLRGVPLVIHEQNAVMGLTNKLLARIAGAVLLADTRAATALLAGKDYRVVGNPVRSDFQNCPPPAQRFAARSGRIHLLVVGGSQGAKALNDVLPQALAQLEPAQRPLVRHQVGSRWVDTVTQAYAQVGVAAEVVAFIDDMAAAFADCDWVLCRSGALTVAEIAAVGVAALCVPLPGAVDDHQTANAQTLVDAGAAQILPQAQMNAATLVQCILDRQDRVALLRQAEAARGCAKPAATREIIQTLERFL